MVGNRNNLIGGWDTAGYNNSGDENFLSLRWMAGKPLLLASPNLRWCHKNSHILPDIVTTKKKKLNLSN